MRLQRLVVWILLATFCITPALSFAAVDKVLGGKWLVYANGLYRQKKYEEAKRAYGTSLRADNTSPNAYQGLGNCYWALGDKANAVKYYKYSLILNPNNRALAGFVAANQSGATASAPRAAVNMVKGPPDSLAPLWRSAILPGWGQFYNKEPVKGWVIGGLTLGSLAGTVVTYMIGDAAKNTYNGLGPGLSQEEYDAPYNTWDSMANFNHIFYITFGLLYTYNLIDAYWNAKPTMRVAMMDYDAPVRLSLLPEGGFKMDATVWKF